MAMVDGEGMVGGGSMTGGQYQQQGGMTHVPAHLQRHGMTYVDPNAPSMIGTSRDNYNRYEDPKQSGDGLFFRLFLQGYARRLDQELEILKLNKTDLSQSAVAKTNFAFFTLFLKATPGLIGIGSTLGFLSLLVFAVTAKFTTYLTGAIVAFVFLQLFLFPYGKIIYSLTKHKIGEKETGKFINTVKGAWHAFEIKYIIMTTLYFLPYYNEKYMTIASNYINSWNFKNPLAQKAWVWFTNFANLENWHGAMKYYLASLLIFAVTYTIGMIIVARKADKERVETVFNMSKEFKRPFELVREKFKDIA